MIEFRIIADYKAVFERDPAARTFFGPLEVILLYSGFHAIFFHRLSHFLHHRLHIPIIPRLLSQLIRFLTGIEIHPGADLGGGFFIDHGMGVVIGETTISGKNTTIYQGVTLGGTGKDRGKRHPTLGDDVIVGAGAKVLGNIQIGSGVRVGAGSVVVQSVPDNCTVVGVPGEVVRRDGKHALNLDHGDLPDPVQELRDRLGSLQKEIDTIETELKDVPHKKHKKS